MEGTDLCQSQVSVSIEMKRNGEDMRSEDVVGQEKNEKLLLRLKNRLDVVELELPTVKARFEKVNVEVDVYAASRALSTLSNATRNKIEKETSSILKDVSGIIKPSRMVLLFGLPSSGKTTILQALSGKLPPNLQVIIFFSDEEFHLDNAYALLEHDLRTEVCVADFFHGFASVP